MMGLSNDGSTSFSYRRVISGDHSIKAVAASGAILIAYSKNDGRGYIAPVPARRHAVRLE